MLSDRGERRLVVGSGVDGAGAINTGREATSNDGGKDAIDSRIIESLEECEDKGIGDGGRRERVDLLNDDMRVADQGSLVVDLSWGGKEVGCSVGEESGLEIVDGDLHGEVDVGWNGVKIGRVLELSRGEISGRENATHDRWVAATALDLRTIGERNASLGQAKVDEIIARGERCDLVRVRGNRAVAVLLKAGLDLRRIELKRRLGITIVVVIPLPYGSATTDGKAVAGDRRSHNLLESGESEEDEG